MLTLLLQSSRARCSYGSEEELSSSWPVNVVAKGAMTAGRGADGYITIPVCASQADSSPLMAMEMTATMQSSYGGGQ